MLRLSAVIILTFSCLFADYFTEKIVEDLAGAGFKYKVVCIGQVVMISGEENETTSLYRARLESDLQASTGFEIVDRQRTDEIMRELELSQAGLTTGNVDIEAGRMLSAQAVIYLEIAELNEGTEVFCRIVEVESSKISFSRSYRDFNEKKVSTSSDYQPLKEYKDLDTSGVSSEGPASVHVIKVDEAQKLGRIGHKKSRENRDYNAVLFRLKKENPKLHAMILEARKGFTRLTSDEELFLLFLLNYPPSQKVLAENAPGQKAVLVKKHVEIRKRHPGWLKHVRNYIRKYQAIIGKDPVIRQIVVRSSMKVAKALNQKGKGGKSGVRKNLNKKQMKKR